MTTCPNCNSTIPGDDTRCPTCAGKLTELGHLIGEITIQVPVLEATPWAADFKIVSPWRPKELIIILSSSKAKSNTPHSCLGVCQWPQMTTFAIQSDHNGLYPLQALLKIKHLGQHYEAKLHLNGALDVAVRLYDSPATQVTNVYANTINSKRIDASVVTDSHIVKPETASSWSIQNGTSLKNQVWNFEIKASDWTAALDPTKEASPTVIVGNSPTAIGQSIQVGLDQVSKHGQIILLPGEYRGSFKIDKDVTIINASTDRRDVCIIPDLDTPIKIYGNPVFQRVTIKAPPNSKNALFQFESGGEMQLKDCDLQDADGNVIESESDEFKDTLLGSQVRLAAIETRLAKVELEVKVWPDVVIKIFDQETNKHVVPTLNKLDQRVYVLENSMALAEGRLSQNTQAIDKLGKLLVWLALGMFVCFGLILWHNSHSAGVEQGLRGPPGQQGPRGQQGDKGYVGERGLDGRPTFFFAMPHGQAFAWVRLDGSKRRQRITPISNPNSAKIGDVEVSANSRNGSDYVQIVGDFRALKGEQRIEIYGCVGRGQDESKYDEPNPSNWIRLDTP